MATQQFNDNVVIQGSQDTAQLSVQGHSVQTAPLQTWQNSAGDTLSRMTEDGRLQIGDFDLLEPGMMATNDALIEVYRDDVSTKPKRGLHVLGRISGALSDAVNWAVQELELVGNGTVTGLHTALRVRLTNQNTGNLNGSQLRAGDFEVSNQGGSSGTPVGHMSAIRAGVVNTQNAHLNEAIGVDVALQQDGGGSGAIVNAYGIRIGNVNQGTSSSYALHTGLGRVRLGDHLEVDGDLDHDGSKIGFFGVTPANRVSATTDIKDALTTYGLLQGTSATALDLDGGTLTGAFLIASRAAGNERQLRLDTGTSPRWTLVANSEAEAGANAGSNFGINRYSDAGAYLGTSILINRASGLVVLDNFAGANFLCQGRLTLTSDVPITIGDVTNATTLYFTPYNGNGISLFNGSVWKIYTFTQRSLSLSGSAANSLYDIFIYDNAGTLTLEAAFWQNSGAGTSARATALVYQDGVFVKNGATSRRYLGTIMTTATAGRTEDSLTNRFVWNYYNRVLKRVVSVNSTNHTYNGGTRFWNNNTSQLVKFVYGYQEDAIQAGLTCKLASGGGLPAVGLGLNQNLTLNVQVDNYNGAYARTNVDILTHPPVGYNYLACLETTGSTGNGLFDVLHLEMELWG